MMSTWAAIGHGWNTLQASGPRVWFVVGALFVLALLMLPLGRSGPHDGGGLLAPLTVDSGVLFRQRPAADFFSVYDAGARLLAGRDPYSVNEDTGQPGQRAPYVATFRYLPVTVLWLCVPLNILPPWPAWYAWVLFCFALQAASYLLCLGRRPEHPLLLGLVWFAWFPLIAEWHMGQFTFFMGVLMLWGFDAYFSRTRGAAWGWALAVLLKVYPVGMAASLWLWGWRTAIYTVAALLIVPTIAWRSLAPDGFNEGMVNRGVGGRIIGELRQPYAGAQGIQAMNGALVWKMAGLQFADNDPSLAPSWAKSLVPLLNGTMLCLYAIGAAWVLWATRQQRCWEAIGYYWLAWFFAYVDCWEHHYVLFQTLLGGLIAWGIIGLRSAVVCWLCAGAPSLWYPMLKLSSHQPMVSEFLGLLYYIQRPIAVILLAVILLIRIAKADRPA